MTARHLPSILAVAAFVSWNALAAPAEAPASDFGYTIKDKKVTLTKYTGDATELLIPEKIEKYPVTELGEKLFEGNASLVRVSIPDTVTWIGNVCFYNCSSLESFKLPKNLYGIGFGCFHGCAKLKDLSFPKRIRVFGALFSYCHSLGTLITGDGIQLLKISADVREYTVPASIREVAAGALGSQQIESVIFEKGTTHIGLHAFNNSKNLISVTLPKTLEAIRAAFQECPSLTEVIFMGDCPKTDKDLFKGTPDVTVYYNPSHGDGSPALAASGQSTTCRSSRSTRRSSPR